MNNIATAGRAKPFHQQHQVQSNAASISRTGVGEAWQYADFGRMKRIEQQARKQSEKL